VHIQVQVDGPSEGLSLRASAQAEGVRVGATAQVGGGWASVTLRLDDVRAWPPDEYFLYDVDLALVESDKTVDPLCSYFGLRSLAIAGPAILLNGQPEFQRVVLDQTLYPDGLCTAAIDDELQKDIERALAMGFNDAGLHQKVFEYRFLHWADRLGYLL
jgi:beta-galactosidase/beta-glucuronidase